MQNYFVPMVEQPQELTTTQYAKSCVKDVKQQFIRETLTGVTQGLYVYNITVSELSKAIREPRIRFLFERIKPVIRDIIVRGIILARLNLFYTKDRCGKVDFWILCGTSDPKEVSLGDQISWYATPGYLKLRMQQCVNSLSIRYNETRAEVCFDCSNSKIYSVSYTDKELFLDQVRGTFNATAQCIYNVTIPAETIESIKKILGKNLTINASIYC